MTIAVVTGAAQGIGAGIAEVLASHGITVALVDVQRSKMIEVRNKIIQNGGDAAVHVTDVTDSNAVKALGNEIVLDHGVPDILVNNAGVLYFQDFLEGDQENLLQIFFLQVLQVTLQAG